MPFPYPMMMGGMNLGAMQLGYDPSMMGGAYPYCPPNVGYDPGAPINPWGLGALQGDELSLGAAPRHPLHPAAHGGGAAAVLHQQQLHHQMQILQKQNALQAKAMQHLQPNEQTQILPFPKGQGGSLFVAPLAIATVNASPQRPFQTQRFAWPSTTSAFFDIIQFTVGQENMMVDAGAVSAEIFAQTGVGVGLSGYIAYPGIRITLQVQNTGSLNYPIQAAIVGSALV